VRKDTVASIKAKYIIEMANGPVTKQAHDILHAEGHVILPDIIANAGGVVVSYLEWLQNKQKESWPESEVNEKLVVYMKKAVQKTYQMAKQKKLSLKEAAFTVALQSLVASSK
jgi:glutamate dehydrogenase/leucine dehydrogenase